jgi:hypothetical protein
MRDVAVLAIFVLVVQVVATPRHVVVLHEIGLIIGYVGHKLLLLLM